MVESAATGQQCMVPNLAARTDQLVVVETEVRKVFWGIYRIPLMQNYQVKQGFRYGVSTSGDKLDSFSQHGEHAF